MSPRLYRLVAIGAFSVTALQLAIPYCYPDVSVHGRTKRQIAADERREFGTYYPDHLFCQTYVRSVRRAWTPKLNAESLDRLWKLETAPSPVAREATVALAMYGHHGHPEITHKQIEKMPALVASRSPIVVGCAETISGWFNLTTYDKQFKKKERELEAKGKLSNDEKVLLWELKCHFGECPAAAFLTSS